MRFLNTTEGQTIFNEFLNQYKASSLKVYQSEIKQFFDFYTKDIMKITEQDIIDYRDHLLKISGKSLTRKISILNRFFSFVEKHIESFKSPVSGKYGSQTKFQAEYIKTNRFENDINKWLEALPVRKNTKQTYKTHILHFFKWHAKNPTEIQTSDLIDYKNLIENKYSHSTVWLKFVSINSFFKHIIGLKKSSELLSFRTLQLTPPAKDKGYYYILQESEIINLLKQPNIETQIGKRDSAILRLMCTYGLRANEVCKIIYEDFDQNRIKGQQKLWIRDRKGKTGKRVNTAIILNGLVLKSIDQWINSIDYPTHKKTPLFNQFKWNISENTLEIDIEKVNSNSPLTVRTIEKIIDKYTQQAKIKSDFTISPHALRHSALTLLAKEGVQLVDLKYLAGHQDISTTMIYIHSVQSYEDNIGLHHPLNKIEA